MTNQEILKKVLEIASEIAKPFEGLHKTIGDKVHPYHDPVGYPTIGYGHLLSKVQNENLKKYPIWTFMECETQLQKDMFYASSRALALSPILGKEENIYRWAAITDFCFNCGDGNYSISTLRKKVNVQSWEESKNEILKWDKAAGKKLPGLTRRRQFEAVFLLKDY